MHVAEEMDDVFGTGQQGQVPLDDDAVETVVYKNQEACKKLLESFHRSPPQKVWLDTKIICPVNRWNQLCLKWSMRCFASWRLGERQREAPMTENAIATEIVDAAFRVHTTRGPGLLESVDHTVLAYELGRRGLRVVSQQAIPVVYDGIPTDT